MDSSGHTLTGNNEDVEALVDTLTIDGATLNETNLSSLSSTDIQQLAELSHELHLSNDMETDEVIIETVEETVQVDTDVMQSEIGAQEIEIETERAPSPEEILPDVKIKTSTIPPLRPLTIAPKPTKAVPIAMKPAPGQQLLLLQGAGGNQAIKLVSSGGQELNLANVSLGRPVAIKPAVKTVTTQGNIALVQPKQVVMKKIVTSTQKTPPKATPTFTNKQGHIMVVQKADQVKLMPSQATLPSPAKTITLQQAQEMGLIATTKVLPQATSTPKHTVVLNKPGPKAIKIVPQMAPTQLLGQKTVVSQIKSPTKILPATQTTTGKVPQRIIFKSAGTGHTILSSPQIIQVAGTQALSTGQLHQINIPGKGMQYIKFVTATNAETLSSSAPTLTTVKSTMQASPTNIVLSEIKPASQATAIAPKPLKNIAAKAPVTSSQVVMLPTYVQTQLNSKVPIPMRHTSVTKQISPESITMTPESNLESNGIRPRKPCNCTKSQCLKLYCDCFANGEFCYMCNCMNCFNNLENEDHRQRAIKTCLERNPNAFRPKIGKAKDVAGDSSIRKHTKGCNCKRSGCLKNYCECYEAKIACSNNCKCLGCRNIEDSMEKKGLRATIEDGLHNLQGKMAQARDPLQFRTRRTSSSRQAINFITDDVIEATSQCMLTISESGDANMQDEEVTKSQIIEEFGRCLKEIIDYSMLHN
ncbi:protein lin-54 homolog isoform X2 [Tribolium madens]|uniref:protein lin-54 homolog isoform X2 n=1 Tax=Tribolium madens TaxID=41895 RepID=UPI001CF73E08|nr:protein lin-54 homolog isoform X2 [Tribolium madens]